MNCPQVKTGEVEKEQQMTEGEGEKQRKGSTWISKRCSTATLSVKLSDMDLSAPKGPSLRLACSSWHTLFCLACLAPQKEKTLLLSLDSSLAMTGCSKSES